MSKEHYIAAHEALVEEYMEAHPNVSWERAYNLTADGAWDRSRGMMADLADHYRQQAKDLQL